MADPKGLLLLTGMKKPKMEDEDTDESPDSEKSECSPGEVLAMVDFKKAMMDDDHEKMVAAMCDFLDQYMGR